jgi:hypothetical protein
MVTEDIAARVTSYLQHQGGKAPDALAELVSGSQARFLQTVEGLSDDVASRKPADDEWSVRELTLHVISAQAGVARLVAGLARGEAPAREARPGVTPPDDARPFADLVEQLRGVNVTMLTSIRELPDDSDLLTKSPHPFFGPLNCREWAAFQRVHDEDHIQHAQKILAAVGS